MTSRDVVRRTGCSKKTQEQDFGILSFISQDINIVKSWDISQKKGENHSYVLITSSFLCNIHDKKCLNYKKAQMQSQEVDKICPFSMQIHFFNEIMTFESLKEEEKQVIWSYQCKYDF